MKFCQAHWDQLRQAIKERGLFDFVAGSEREAVETAVDELKGQPQTLNNFDPLMAAHWAICNKAMEFVRNVGGEPLAMLFGNQEHPEWECPICYLNWLSVEHDRNCTDPQCPKEKGLRFESWINDSADGAANYIKTLPPG